MHYGAPPPATTGGSSSHCSLFTHFLCSLLTKDITDNNNRLVDRYAKLLQRMEAAKAAVAVCTEALERAKEVAAEAAEVAAEAGKLAAEEKVRKDEEERRVRERRDEEDRRAREWVRQGYVEIYILAPTSI